MPILFDTDDQACSSKLGLIEGMTERSHPNAREVLLPADGFNISRYQLSTLLGKSWLNDQVINYYFKLVEAHYGPRIACLGSHFYSKLEKGDLDGAARWTRRLQLLCSTVDVVFVVVNSGVHWTLCVVVLSSREIGYLDSMNGSGEDVMRRVKIFFQAEYERTAKMMNTTTSSSSYGEEARKRLARMKAHQPVDWKTVSVGRLGDHRAPQQENGYDCGVFACQYGLNVARTGCVAPAMDFTQKDIPFLRKLMVLELAQGQILDRM